MKWAKLRWFLAACALLLSWKLMASALEADGFSNEAIAVAPSVIFSLLAFLSSILLISPETAFRIAEWCSRPFAAIFFPDDEFSRPPLTYSLARRYRDEKRWGDAARQYRKIIRYYPKESAAYVELLEVAEHLGDHAMQRKYTALFRKQFKEELFRTI